MAAKNPCSILLFPKSASETGSRPAGTEALADGDGVLVKPDGERTHCGASLILPRISFANSRYSFFRHSFFNGLSDVSCR